MVFNSISSLSFEIVLTTKVNFLDSTHIINKIKPITIDVEMVTVEYSRGIKAIKFVSIRIGKTIENITAICDITSKVFAN